MQAYIAYTIGMKKNRPTQYTVRGISRAVDNALRERARRLGRSLNQVAVEVLTEGAGQGGAEIVHGDLEGFFGSWVADPLVDQALADQRRVDGGLWK